MWSRGLENTVRRRKSNWYKKLGPQASASILSPIYTTTHEQLPRKGEPGSFSGTLHSKNGTFGRALPAWPVL
jgi:hypothetical protein